MASIGQVKWDRTKGRPEPIRALNLVYERENHEPLVALSEVCPQVLMVRDQVIPYLRKRVAEMLGEAANRLPASWRLGVIDAWRPIERQRRIYEFVTKSAIEAFGEMPHAQLRRKVCRWVAPVDQKAPPGHCTGAAVDVWLVNEVGEQVDVCSPYTRFQAAPTYTLGLSPEAEFARNTLRDAMLEVGFSNCRDEWWHYSYGDAGWAVRMGMNECCYGLAKLDPDLYRRQEELWLEAMKERTNPFLS